MKARVLLFAAPLLAVWGSATAAVTVGLGDSEPRWVQFLWPLLTMVWALLFWSRNGRYEHERAMNKVRAQALADIHDLLREREDHDGG